MSQRAKRPCNKPACTGLVDPPQRYCVNHAALEQSVAQQHDQWRGSSARRGYDGAWVKVRNMALRRDGYLCQLCRKENRIVVAAVVDHIVPVKVAPDRRLDLSNLQGLCTPHHQRKTAEDMKLYD